MTQVDLLVTRRLRPVDRFYILNGSTSFFVDVPLSLCWPITSTSVPNVRTNLRGIQNSSTTAVKSPIHRIEQVGQFEKECRMRKTTHKIGSQTRKTSEADLRAAARLIAKLGGIEQAKLAIETLAKIRRAA